MIQHRKKSFKELTVSEISSSIWGSKTLILTQLNTGP